MAGPGGLLPHSVEAEESVLGAMLLSAHVTAEVVVLLRAEDFYVPAHGHVFDAVSTVFSSASPVDAVTVAEAMSRGGLLDQVGGSIRLVELQAGTPSTSNAAHYARIVADYAAQRRLVGAGHEIVGLGMDLTAELDTVRDHAEQVLYAATHQRTTSATTHVGESLAATLDAIEQLYADPGHMSGVPTGFMDLDATLRGLQPGELYVIGARPSMGKSILGLNIAAHVALTVELPALLFSLEMSAGELNKRLLSALTQIPHDRFRSGQFTETDWVHIADAVGRLAGSPLHLNDSSRLTILELKAEARRLQALRDSAGCDGEERRAILLVKSPHELAPPCLPHRT